MDKDKLAVGVAKAIMYTFMGLAIGSVFGVAAMIIFAIVTEPWSALIAVVAIAVCAALSFTLIWASERSGIDL